MTREPTRARRFTSVSLVIPLRSVCTVLHSGLRRKDFGEFNRMQSLFTMRGESTRPAAVQARWTCSQGTMFMIQDDDILVPACTSGHYPRPEKHKVVNTRKELKRSLNAMQLNGQSENRPCMLVSCRATRRHFSHQPHDDHAAYLGTHLYALGPLMRSD